MAQSKLLVHPQRGADGVGHRITPASAGWRYVGFETRTLKEGAKSKLDTADEEVCVVDPLGQGAGDRERLQLGNDRRAQKRVRRAALVGLSAPA